MLVDLARLEREYFERRPDLDDPEQLVSFGTSGHRGSPLRGSFTEAHILAITQAICDYRRAQGIDGPLLHGQGYARAFRARPSARRSKFWRPTTSRPIIQRDDGVTPTPVISRAILVLQPRPQASTSPTASSSRRRTIRRRTAASSTTRRNGGPADTDVTQWIEDRANELLRSGNAGVKRVPFAAAISAETTHQEDFVLPYVNDLRNVIDMDAIRAAGLKLGVDPLGGAAVHYWEPINAIYGLNIAVVNPKVDPTFSFMTVDHDGKIRMDCSSPYAMARLVGLKDQYHVAFANDPDSDRHGIVTPSAGLMNPNHYLAVAIRYLLTHRPHWPANAAVGKTLVSSSMIDRVVREARPPAVRGAGRLQVVRAGPVRRLVLLRRRGKRRRQLPAPRRHRLDDRQGRPDHGPAGGRDHGPHRQGSRRALPRADGGIRRRRTTRGSTRRRHPSRRRG